MHHVPDIEAMRCPYTGLPLRVERVISSTPEGIRYGTARSNGHRYPIVDGILILLPQAETVVAALDETDVEAALRASLYELVPGNARTRRRRVVDFLGQLHPSLTTGFHHSDAERTWRTVAPEHLTFAAAAYRLRHRAYADYLVYRFANPSFAAAIASLAAFRTLDTPRPRVLDLGCGTGHATFIMQCMYPGVCVTATDHDFINLYLGSRFLAPDASFVCADSEVPLPYPEDHFDGVFCLDAFHYLASKAALTAELERVVRRHGLWLMPHLHNACKQNPTPGRPLPPETYLHVFRAIRPRLFSEAKMLGDLMRRQTLDLRTEVDPRLLSDAHAFCLLGNGTDDLWHTFTDVLEPLYRSRHALAVNPLYRSEVSDASVLLAAAWPSPFLHEECIAIDTYLPSEVTIPRPLWHRIRRKVTTSDDAADLEALARRLVLVPLPGRYGTDPNRRRRAGPVRRASAFPKTPALQG